MACSDTIRRCGRIGEVLIGGGAGGGSGGKDGSGGSGGKDGGGGGEGGMSSSENEEEEEGSLTIGTGEEWILFEPDNFVAFLDGRRRALRRTMACFRRYIVSQKSCPLNLRDVDERDAILP